MNILYVQIKMQVVAISNERALNVQIFRPKRGYVLKQYTLNDNNDWFLVFVF